MSTTPVITIFVRHSTDCKYKADETSRRCKCRKHLRWTEDGKQYRRKANTRSWDEAEQVKQDLLNELSGKPATTPARPTPSGTPLQTAIDVFIRDKRHDVSDDVVKKYTRLLSRLQDYCNEHKVETVRDITVEHISGFCANWPELYPSGNTRIKLRERLRAFLRYCFDARWLDHLPRVPKFKAEEPETQPLTNEEYERLIDAVYTTIEGQRDNDKWQHSVYTFLQTMRWTGLSIGDTMRLKRNALMHDGSKGLYKVITKRQKTGVPVAIPIPAEVGRNLEQVQNGNSEYFFWSGVGKVQSATSNWGQRFIAPVFKAAGIVSEGHMLSHRLRDTFAVSLLEKGVPMEEVSKLLGHTSIRITEKHYAKWSKARQDRLDALVTGTWSASKKKKSRPGRKPKVVEITDAA